MALLTACEELPRIAAGVCGNHVVEAPEECDFPGKTCHAPGTKNQCRMNCREKPCAPGAGCGTDDVCRMPTGQLDWKRIREFSLSFPLKTADVSGDGRTDVLFGTFGRLATATFQGTQVVSLGELPVGYFTLRSGKLNDDNRDDLIALHTINLTNSNSVRVLHADPTGALTSISQLEPGPGGQTRRLLSGDCLGDGVSRPLLISDSQLYQVPERSFAQWGEYLLAELEVSGASVVDRPVAADFDAETACDEVAVARAGAREVLVYSLCAPPGMARIGSVRLPDDATVSWRGLLAGDVNNDGLEDLLIDGDRSELWDDEIELTPTMYVSYGRGDGTFDSHAETVPGVGDNRASQLWLPYGGSVLAAADLDGDGQLDFVQHDSFMLSTMRKTCEESFVCGREHAGGWSSAATGDFNGDGLMDVIGIRWGERGLTFMRGLRTGDETRFNEFSIPTQGLPLTSPINEMDDVQAVLAVGDFNGDLVSDLAFSERAAVQETRPTLTVLFGTAAPAVPSEMRHVDTVDEIRGLQAGRLFEREDTLSDLVMLARRGKLDGLARLSGQTSGELFSPLGIPESADRKSSLELVDAALGRFRSVDGKPVPIDDLIMLATRYNQQTERTKLYFVANTLEGFESGDVDQSPYELTGDFDVFDLAMNAIDLDGNGVEELVVYPLRIVDGRFTYWLVQRMNDQFVVTARIAEVRGATPILASNYDTNDYDRTPRDIDADGHMDLILSLAEVDERLDEELEGGRSFEVVLFGTGDLTLERGQAFEVPTLVADATYLQLDDDPELELAVVNEVSLDLYDLSLPDGRLVAHSTYPMEGDMPLLVETGDFNGDGVEDLVTSGLATGIFLGKARNP